MSRVTLFLFLSIIACSQPKKDSESMQAKNISEPNNDNHQSNSNSLLSEGEVYPTTFELPMNGIGVVVINSTIGRSNPFVLFNSDSTVFAEISYSTELFKIEGKSFKMGDIDNKILESSFGFSPRLFYSEYGIFHFDCIAKNESYYEVLINPEKGTTMRVKADSTELKFYTWEEYILGAYIMFDPNANSLRAQPSNNSDVVYEFNDFYFKGIEIKGDWLRVKCNSDCKVCEKGDMVGWIRWKHERTLLIQIGFIC